MRSVGGKGNINIYGGWFFYTRRSDDVEESYRERYRVGEEWEDEDFVLMDDHSVIFLLNIEKGLPTNADARDESRNSYYF